MIDASGISRLPYNDKIRLLNEMNVEYDYGPVPAGSGLSIYLNKRH